ncbi:MAG: creatininase family protein [Woeseiaceae bacterium]
MRIADMNWQQVESYLLHDDRCVLPVGSVEQHAQLSLCVDAILSERVAVEAAEPLHVPVYPCMPYGLAPYFSAFPGSMSLRVETLLAVFRDLIASVRRSGFRRVLIVNGHGGNAPVANLAKELMANMPEMSIKYHPWWSGTRVTEASRKIDPIGSHASWIENFPWTRLANSPAPDGEKTLVDYAQLDMSSPEETRTLIGDGNFGGAYQKADSEMLEIWKVGVAETRAILEGPWPDHGE